MFKRKKCALPNGSIVRVRLLLSEHPYPGRMMLMSDFLRENGIAPNQVHIIDTEREFELIGRGLVSASLLDEYWRCLL